MAARWRARGTAFLFSGSSSSSSSSSLVAISSWLAREKLPGRAVFVEGFNDHRGMDASASPPVAFLRGTAAPAQVASSSLTSAASAMVVGVVGRRRPPLATSSTSMPVSSTSSPHVRPRWLPPLSCGRRSPLRPSPSCGGRQRPPLIASSSSTSVANPRRPSNRPSLQCCSHG